MGGRDVPKGGVCSRCGERFLGTIAHGHGGDYRYYTCGTRQRKGTARCDQQRLPADKLEDGFIQITIDALLSKEPFRRAAEAQRAEWESSHPSLQDDILTAKEAIAERHRAMRQYMAAFEKGDMPSALCGERLRELETGSLVWSEELYRIYGHAPEAWQPTLEGFLSATHAEDPVAR